MPQGSLALSPAPASLVSGIVQGAHLRPVNGMSDRRLPLPGEQPIGVWRPRPARRSWWRGRSGRIGWLLPLAAVALIVFVATRTWQRTATPVTIVLNGEPIPFNTHRRTVGGALYAAGVRPEEAIYLIPPADTPLYSGMVIAAAYLRPVMVHLDGQTRVGIPHETDPRAIVEELYPVIGPADAVRVDRRAQPAPAEVAAHPVLADMPILPLEISVVRPATVIVTEQGQRVAFQTTAATLGEALTSAGYVLYEADRLSPSPGTAIPPGGQIEVTLERAVPVTISADGVTRVVRTHRPTVGELLDELGLALTGSDYVLPGPDMSVALARTVQVIRVREETLAEELPIPFETVYVPDPDLELDQQRVIQEGRDGVLNRQVRVRYEDGVEISRLIGGEWVVRQPEARVIAYGTRIVIRTLETPYGPLQYWRRLHMLATSYTPLTSGGAQPGEPGFGLTATGVPVRVGVVAVDPDVISLYTRLYVPGYGPARALDVGGAIKGLRIDLGYPDEAYLLWNEWVDVYLLTPVPPPDRIIWVLPQ